MEETSVMMNEAGGRKLRKMVRAMTVPLWKLSIAVIQLPAPDEDAVMVSQQA